MIDFIDFKPKYEPGIFASTVQPLSFAIDDMNDWIEENKIEEIINIETILMPNIYEEQGHDYAPRFRIYSSNVRWYQVIRLWYRK